MKVKKSFRAILSQALAISLVVLALAGGLPVQTAHAAGKTYYVDSAAGNDSSNGTSQSTPWKTLARVKTGAAAFKPGDQILLKSGSIWNESLDISFSGSSDNVITIGKYGGAAKPVINGGGRSYAVRIVNQQNITLQDLEITNFNATNYNDYLTNYYRRSGVWVQAFHNGPMSNIRLAGLDIHDITGISVTAESWVTSTDGEKVNKNSNAAILLNAWEWETNVAPNKHAYYNGLLVENNNIHDIKTVGITLDGHAQQTDPSLYHKNVVVRNNTISKTGSDAIIIGISTNPVIEHNVAYDAGIHSVDGKWIAGIWVWKTYGATIRNNEVARMHYQNSANTDSNAFDVDILTEGDHLFQYNYSHDNSGGFTMDMGQLKNGTNIYRYNISQNDAHHGFTGYTLNISDPSLYYNNVFYNDNGDGFVIKNNAKATFINNIFYTSKGNIAYPSGPKFYYNDFFGSAPPLQGVKNLTADPLFVNPGTGADGIGTTGGYKLQPSSPLIVAGRVMTDNGGQDFWGNTLYKGSPDIGVYEDPDSTAADTTAPEKPSGLAVTGKTDTTATLVWSASENSLPLDGDIYDAATDAKLASVMMSNTATLGGLTADTNYSFYVIARDMSGNASVKSDPIAVRTTIAATVVDNAAAAFTGNWVQGADATAYNNDYLAIAPGTGANAVTWTPNLPQDGYYSVYYRLPSGTSGRASNAPFTVNADGGSKTYTVNERQAGGVWLPLGLHKFKAGTAGNVVLKDNANGEVAADAVKFQLVEGFGSGSITQVSLTAPKLQLKLGSSMGLAVLGQDQVGGNALDLIAAGYSVQFVSDSPAVTVSAGGVATGNSQGTATIKAIVAIDGSTFTSSTIQVISGPYFSVETPAVTDITGQQPAGMTPYGNVQASTRVINSTDKQQNVTLVIAVYNQKGLVKSEMASIIVRSYENGVLKCPLVLPGDMSGSYLKVFVWDGKDAMHPLTALTTYPN